MKRSDFHYQLPARLIAQQPLPERTASRLLCLDRVSGAISDRHFIDLTELLAAGDLLVFNNTRVLPARFFGHKETGGKVEILLERLLNENQAMVQIRASKIAKPGITIQLTDGFQITVLGREDEFFRIQLAAPANWGQLFARVGHMPLPPYIDRPDTALDQQRYQTVYASQDGAVAAPTAGLHFDQALLDGLQTMGVGSAFVTLHVAAGTFQPVRVDDIREHRMHAEFLMLPQATVDAVQQTKASGGRVIAVGTTSVRSLETAAADGELKAYAGDSRLFIYPGYRFNVIDGLITNFHLPESTLLMLVSALAGRQQVMAAYHHAIAMEYRFFSYGDAMLII